MRMLAEQAGVSKSLIFFYFNNKAELYMALWNHAAEITYLFLDEYGSHEDGLSFFDILDRCLNAKAEMMRKYPDIYRFVLRAYYEKDSKVSSRIRESYRKALMKSGRDFAVQLQPEAFRKGLDLKQMYKTILLASEGFVYTSVMNNRTDADTFEREYSKLIGFWRELFERR